MLFYLHYKKILMHSRLLGFKWELLRLRVLHSRSIKDVRRPYFIVFMYSAGCVLLPLHAPVGISISMQRSKKIYQGVSAAQ